MPTSFWIWPGSAQKSDALSFMAELDGQPIATGAMILGDGVALLAGASTIPEARRQGAQLALLDGDACITPPNTAAISP